MSTYKKQTKKWTMRSGETIRICDMDDRHLLNSYKMCLRIGAQERQAAIDFADGGFMGEMAQDYANHIAIKAMNSEDSDYAPEIICNLEREIRRRGLQP